jgi:hypothetical protein
MSVEEEEEKEKEGRIGRVEAGAGIAAILSILTFFLICIGGMLTALALLLAVANENDPAFPANPAEEEGKLNPTVVTPSFPCEVVAEEEEEEDGPALSISSSS